MRRLPGIPVPSSLFCDDVKSKMLLAGVGINSEGC